MTKNTSAQELFGFVHQVVFATDRKANALCAEANLKSGFPEFLLLHTLHHHKEASQHTIADCLNITPGAVSRRLDTLVKRGLAKREADKQSRRTNRIILTQKGVLELEKIDKALQKGFEKAINTLSEQEIKQTCKTLEKLLTSLNNN